ncbi:hypothetical protein LEP1GSC050_0538 [Leptospira broomii serovar Hurstbridge str. 5399]|uniref:Uncharacterized protein n=1 Tax=Leptospira broomii serovar Hurstbridge str. 5399 TaxID=1049789 RepID=T0FGX6_9LEPT|nr:hypothetical protein LEP1GSC050_0538 [Leptospira broomii serovar Hurstbridge str. 5399]
MEDFEGLILELCVRDTKDWPLAQITNRRENVKSVVLE